MSPIVDEPPTAPPIRQPTRMIVHLHRRLLRIAGVLALGAPSPSASAAAPPPVHQRTPLHLQASSPELVGFTALPPTLTGITFTNRLDEERSLTNQILLNGSGVAAGDVDGDGLCDLYFCGLDAANSLQRNQGNWRFEDITATAGVGVACADQASTGAALADLDGDGDLDLLVNGLARGTRLFLNDGRAHFTEATATSGLPSPSGSASFALADIDNDGRLDVYVVNYRSQTMRDQPGIVFTFGATSGVRQLLSVDGRPATDPELQGRFTFDGATGVLENGEADALYRNLGGGKFQRLDWTDGTFLDERGRPMSVPYDWGLSAMFRDLNRDGAPDLYVCNDFQSPDRIWLNDGKGRFQALPRPALRQTSLFSMGVDFADLDRDGHDDCFVADMLSREHVRRQVQVMNATAFLQSRRTTDDRPQFSRNTLFRNRGDGTFAEIAQLAGLAASDWTWCPAFLDVDLDGYEDLLVTTGHQRDAQDADAAREVDALTETGRLSPREQLRQRRRFPRLETPNFAFRNQTNLTFSETGSAWGFDSRRVSQGMALADLDQDGDLDVVINCLDDGPLLYRNETSRPRVGVRLRGQAPNSHGVGARIHVRAPGLPEQSQELICGGRYLSSDDPVRSFAAGSATNRLALEVFWRSGRRTLLADVPANHLYEIAEPASPPIPTVPAPAPPALFFEDRSRILGHQHVDQPFDDFVRQPLLPHTLSQPGPAVAWFDFNSDGWEDLLVGAGRGGRIAVFRNDGQGGFIPQRAQVLQTPSDRDLTGLLGWNGGSTGLALLIGLDSYETHPESNSPALRQLSLVTGRLDDTALAGAGCTGPLAMGDLDGDGDLDLFVGGRVVPGRYPEAASSTLLLNADGRLTPHRPGSQALRQAGLVQGAVFTDLSGDAHPELVLACLWGPPRIFRHHGGTLVPWDAPLRWAGEDSSGGLIRSLHALTGWWNSVAAGDFDEDGRLDLVLGNWGRNTARQAFLTKPLRLHYAELDDGGGPGLLEAHYDANVGDYVPTRDRHALASVFPGLLAAFPTFAAFAHARLSDILAAGLPPTRYVEAATLDSLLLLNRGDGFEVHRLPLEAQLAPVFGVAVGDLDGDGHQDLFLAQNFFGTSVAESRLDAGNGAWLRGDGRGGFTAEPPARSGLLVPGEARGAAVCDFDHDGRLDLAVGQNRGLTLLYRNTRGEPGLRLTLRGGRENPHAVGARARVEFAGGRLGPATEVRLGGGYWSQDSPTLVLSLPSPPTAVVVRWPGGATQRTPVPEGEVELELAPTPPPPPPPPPTARPPHNNKPTPPNPHNHHPPPPPPAETPHCSHRPACRHRKIATQSAASDDALSWG